MLEYMSIYRRAWSCKTVRYAKNSRGCPFTVQHSLRRIASSIEIELK